MKSSEIIRQHSKEIREALIENYRHVIACEGRIWVAIYIWEDGEIQTHEDLQGSNSWLQPRYGEPRELFHVYTIEAPNFSPWDVAGESAPDDEAQREAMEAEILDYCVDEYRQRLDELMDEIIAEAEHWDE